MRNYEFVDDYSERTHPTPDSDSRFYRKYKPELSLSNPTVTYSRGNRRLIDNTVSIPENIRQACKSANVPLIYLIYRQAIIEANRLNRDELRIYMNMISLPAFRGMTYEDSDI